MKRRWIVLAVVLWLIWLWLCEPPKRFEDLTPAERLRSDIEAAAIF